MSNADNPAGRLFLLINRFRSHPDKTTVVKAWADVFGISEKKTSEILVEISEVVKLMEEAKKQIHLQDVKLQLYMRPFGEIEKIFALGFGHQMSHVKPILTDSVMSDLEFCDDLLSRMIGEKVIEEKKLEDLETDIIELLTEVLSSGFPQDLITLTVDSLTKILFAISHYHIHGIKGLRDALDAAYGSAIFYATHDYEYPDENGKELMKKYGNMLARVMAIVADASAVALLAAGAIDRVTPLLQALN